MYNLPQSIRFKVRTFLVIGLTLTGISCSEQEIVNPVKNGNSTSESLAIAGGTTIVYGDPVKINGKPGAGKAWVMLNAEGKPISLGFDISEAAILKLSEINEEEFHGEYEYSLDLPNLAPPFDHIDFGYNPNGHEPNGIYNVKHFDAHFYIISPDEQDQIQGLNPFDESGNFVFDEAPKPKYIPFKYNMEPGVVPKMGAHWVDAFADEFNNRQFTKTFIYGSYKGNVIFLEPMYTWGYLRQNSTQTTPIRTPEAYQKAGYYPLSYTIGYHQSERSKFYRVSLDNLIYHKAN